MPVGLNLAQLNRISDPSDPYNLDAAMAESVSSAVQGPQHPVFPPMRQERIAAEGVVGGAEFAPSSVRPITERILTPSERTAARSSSERYPRTDALSPRIAVDSNPNTVSGAAQGRPNTVQMIPDIPGEKALIERRQRERRGR